MSSILPSANALSSCPRPHGDSSNGRVISLSEATSWRCLRCGKLRASAPTHSAHALPLPHAAEGLFCVIPQVSLLKWNGRVISVDVPNTVELEVVQTDPGVKGNTASGARPSFQTLCLGIMCPDHVLLPSMSMTNLAITLAPTGCPMLPPVHRAGRATRLSAPRHIPFAAELWVCAGQLLLHIKCSHSTCGSYNKGRPASLTADWSAPAQAARSLRSWRRGQRSRCRCLSPRASASRSTPAATATSAGRAPTPAEAVVCLWGRRGAARTAARGTLSTASHGCFGFVAGHGGTSMNVRPLPDRGLARSSGRSESDAA